MSQQQHVEYQVDQLLLDQGEYLPLEFLLQEGQLNYSDYESWRSGDLNDLDQALFSDPEPISQQLQQAANYMERRGWQSERLGYKTWGSEMLQPLRFSQDKALNDYFHRCYRKPQEQLQMDLFTDAPTTSQANGIREALIARNTSEARRLLERLYDTAPDHQQLGAFEQLVEAAERIAEPVNEITSEMQRLQQSLTPLAESVMGRESRSLLVPLWRRLSNALEAQPFEPSQAEQHLSYTASHATDWQMVIQAVERETDWQNSSILLIRYATACDHLHQKTAALQSWFTLCWQSKVDVAPHLERCTNRELQQQWNSFMELESELPPQTFPAWALLNKPGISKVATDPAGLTIEAPASYATLFQLQKNRSTSPDKVGNIDEKTMVLRAQLKQQDPILFSYFLNHTQAR